MRRIASALLAVSIALALAGGTTGSGATPWTSGGWIGCCVY
jgi:hypothetical protein